jgi:hypothetical protein
VTVTAVIVGSRPDAGAGGGLINGGLGVGFADNCFDGITTTPLGGLVAG